MDLIEQARQHLRNGNKAGYAQLLSSEHNGAFSARVRSAIKRAIIEDGNISLFHALASGVLVPNRQAIDAA